MAEPRRRRRLLVTVFLVVVALGVVSVVLVQQPWRRVAPAPEPAGPTAALVRTDLVLREQFDGTLGYDGSFAIPGQAVSGGVLTALPAAGQVIRRGEQVYGVNGRPVPLLVGPTPFWRRLAVGVDDGPDVVVLKDNLRELGVGPRLGRTDTFTRATADALARWQRALGVPDTGELELGAVVVAPSELRVTAVAAVLGAPPAGTLLTASSTTRIVTADVPVARQALARQGAAVRIGLPGGTTTTGTIASVGTVATGAPDDQANGGADRAADATIPMRITLDVPADAGTLDGAPVTVDVVSDTHTGVLAAPVNALLANPDGSYAVDVVERGVTRRVRVELGFFADGLVEVRGPGLTEGTRVEVPSSS